MENIMCVLCITKRGNQLNTIEKYGMLTESKKSLKLITNTLTDSVTFRAFIQHEAAQRMSYPHAKQ
jgi:hypothetical protein